MCASAATHMSIHKQKHSTAGRKAISYCKVRRYCKCSALLDGSEQQCRLICCYLHHLSTNIATSTDLSNSTVYTLAEE